MSENILRQPEDHHQPCLTCNRKFFKADAHFCCDRCRKFDERAACPEDCDACIAMKEEEWRRKALEMNVYKKKMYERSKSSKPYTKSRKTLNKKKVIKGKSEKTERPLRVAKSDKPKKQTIDPVYAKRLSDYEDFLYGSLNPTIPISLTGEGFKLPGIPKHLKSMYDITKCELVRLLASSSICYHLSKNRSQFCDENNQIFNANSDGIVSLFAALIKFKANSLGKIILDIREALLSGVTCADPEIIPQMIKGPINPNESFFGNIEALIKAVNEDNENVLKMKGKSSKNPSRPEEINDNNSDSDDSE